MFKDLFSGHAADYRAFRPTYPRELFDFLAGLAPRRRLALDVATGNGQAALALADRFDAVLATDRSLEQLTRAETHARIRYAVASAEVSPLPDACVDLITCAQAFHWLDHPRFFAEAARVARPGAPIAVWCYGLATIDPAVDGIVRALYDGPLAPDWEPERRLVDEGYRGIASPLAEVETPVFAMKAQWTRAQWMGYLGTWSAVRKHRARTGQDPLPAVDAAIAPHWREDDTKEVRWALAVRVWRIDGRTARH